MKTTNVVKLVKNAIVAALYMVLTLIIAPLSYGDVQFRISEIMLLFMLINSDYAVGLIIGCALANMFSPLGVIDVIFGTIATILSVWAMSKTKNQIIASLFPAISNGLIVGAELSYLYKLPYAITAFSVAFGEFVTVSCIGLVVFKIIMLNKNVVRILS